MKVNKIINIFTKALAGLLLLVGALIIGTHIFEGKIPSQFRQDQMIMTVALLLMFIGAIVTFFNRFWGGLLLIIAYSIKTIFEGIDFNLYLDLFLILSILNFFQFYLEINDKN